MIYPNLCNLRLWLDLINGPLASVLPLTIIILNMVFGGGKTQGGTFFCSLLSNVSAKK